jgi:hypothetical protein
MEHHVRVFLIKEGKIKQLVVIVDPEEDARLRSALNMDGLPRQEVLASSENP